LICDCENSIGAPVEVKNALILGNIFFPNYTIFFKVN
jgi:hypothetical protein